MIKHLCIVLILVLFSSCYKDEKADTGYQAIREFSRQKCKENKWGMEVIGGGFSGDDFRLSLGFVMYDRYYTIPEARKILVETMDEFLNYLNNNENIKKYISCFPLTYKNIRLSFSFNGSNQSHVSSEYICYVSKVVNCIAYRVWEYDGNRYDLQTVHREAYKDAFRAVKIDPSYVPEHVVFLRDKMVCTDGSIKN